jgi:DinB superfamily
MPTANDMLVHTLTTSQGMLNRYCDDLKPEEYLHRPCAGGNCAAWLIGHLILTERKLLERMGVTADLPALPDGFEKRFSRDPEAPKASDFGDVTILLPLFNKHRQLLIEAARRAPAELLDKRLEQPHPFFATVGEIVNVLGGPHVAMHGGQITIIRRSLGRPPIV